MGMFVAREECMPRRASEEDAGYVLVSDEDRVVPPGERIDIKTGVTVTLPHNYRPDIRPIPGRLYEDGVRVNNSSQTGCTHNHTVIYAEVHNIGNSEVAVKRGEPLCSVVFLPDNLQGVVSDASARQD